MFLSSAPLCVSRIFFPPPFLHHRRPYASDLSYPPHRCLCPPHSGAQSNVKKVNTGKKNIYPLGFTNIAGWNIPHF